ncbi:MAG: hypothetical protein F6K53_15290 [Moorea sp. SIO4A1]|nr:hypothetical protein [Moorena sp. SIO4A1]
MGKTWDDPEGEEKKNNEQAMQRGLGGFPHRSALHRFLIPHTPHPTPHTPHPTPHTPHPTPDVFVKNIPLKAPPTPSQG